MNGGKISDNSSSSMGTVYIGPPTSDSPGSFTMKGGMICDNSYTGQASDYSPSVYIAKGSFTMEGGEITRNTTSQNYGGVSINNSENSVFTMTGGKIYGNTNIGVKVANTTKFYIGGSAYITSDNVVSLQASNSLITIAGVLTPPAEANGISATIQLPSNATVGKQVFAIDDNANTTILREKQKFTLLSTDFGIDSNGCLTENDVIALSSSDEQTTIGDEIATNDYVVVNLESDFTPTPLESYTNGGGFSDGGKDCVIKVPVGKTLVLSSDTPVIIEPSVRSGYFFDVYGTLIIGPNVTISGKSGGTSKLHWNIISIKSGGKVVLEGGTITENVGGGSLAGAVIIFGGGIFTMESGLITNSNAGVYIYEQGRFIMNGGEISSNTSSGVIVSSNGTFIKTGGSVKNNTNSSDPDKSQLSIAAGGKYGSSEDNLTTYSEGYGISDEF